ncbi:MAG: hypothetical protein GY866_16735 [Proteobacteria bacterium]|nr:hypothetical protein [Pseudomonadota bacterium]
MFDKVIVQIKKWFDQRDAEGSARRYEIPRPDPADAARSETPDRKSIQPKIILKEDTHLELGHPSAGSVNATLATHDPSMVENGRVTLVGPDISETNQGRLPFAQIVVAQSTGALLDAPANMDRVLHRFGQSNGYMIRSVPNLIWSRISKEAARSGFSLPQLGTRLLNALWRECQDIQKAEVFFVTRKKEDISGLEKIIEEAKTKLRKLKAFKRTDDGEYECDSSLDCDECDEQEVCDNIRDVIKIRKGDRVISFGEEGTAEERTGVTFVNAEENTNADSQ